MEPVYRPNEKTVQIIGCGSIGAKICLELSRMQVRRWTVWDPEEVEPKNLKNQPFLSEHVGESKALAIAGMCRKTGGTEPFCRVRRWMPGDSLSDIVFMAVDSMNTRREVVNQANFDEADRTVIDVRVGLDSGIVWGMRRPDYGRWLDEFYTSEEAERSVCGDALSESPTGSLMASIAVWEYINMTSGRPGARWLINLRPVQLHYGGYHENGTDLDGPEREYAFGTPDTVRRHV